MAREVIARLWRTISGANARQRRREEDQRLAEERAQWVAHEQMMSRARENNRREMVHALFDPATLPWVKERLFEALYDD
jgi:hypothetical protein